MKTETYQGTVVRVFGNYGFVFSEKLERRIFFHVSAVNSVKDPEVGETVEFELGKTKTADKPEVAVNVRPVKVGGGVQ
jgi:cold shock CspA family protein